MHIALKCLIKSFVSKCSFILGREAFHFKSMLFASLYLPSGVNFFLIFHDYSQPALKTRGGGGHFEQFGGADERKD